MTDDTRSNPQFEIMVTEAMIENKDWDRKAGPFYRVNDVSKFFFGMSSSWLRLKMKPDRLHPDTWFTVNGKPMDFRRLDKDKVDSARVFWLSDIELMAYSLYAFGSIDEARLARILAIVRATADLYDLFDDEPGDPPE
jgi:hypothetical protein